MGVLKSNAALVGVILLLDPLVPYRLAQSRDAETVVPVGALAHAAYVFKRTRAVKSWRSTLQIPPVLRVLRRPSSRTEAFSTCGSPHLPRT
jgi:hypothetical protein